MYLLSGEDIKKLVKGKLKPKDVISVGNLCLFGWTGQDILRMLKSRGLCLDAQGMEGVIDDVYEDLGQYASEIIYPIIENALDSVLADRQE